LVWNFVFNAASPAGVMEYPYRPTVWAHFNPALCQHPGNSLFASWMELFRWQPLNSAHLLQGGALKVMGNVARSRGHHFSFNRPRLRERAVDDRVNSKLPALKRKGGPTFFATKIMRFESRKLR
jgi:hypothetical protein